MEYGQIPYVKNKVSRIVFGLGSPMFWAGQDASELLNAVCAAGINTFDTARVYGASEQTFGKWMEEYHTRDKVVIVSKCGHPDLGTWEKRVDEKEMRRDLEASLDALRTDHIDIYLLHRDDPEKAAGELVEVFNAMHAEGKIGAFGASNWTHQRIEEANEYAYKHNLIPFTVSSPNFSLAERVKDALRDCISITGPAQEPARAWYRDRQMPVIAYACLAHGFLSGRIKSAQADKAGEILSAAAAGGYGCPANFERLRRCEELAAQKRCTVSQIALAWVLRQELNTFAVVSASDIGRLRSNMDALSIDLSMEELLYLDLREEKQADL